MNIIITGGDGDIAQAIKKKLESSEINLYYPVNVFTPSRKQLDVTDEESIVNYFRLHSPDVLINNAAVIQPESIEKLTKRSLDHHFSVNTIGAALCAKHAIRHNAYLIINIASSAGCKGKKGWYSYCASKAALIMLTECLVEEGEAAVTISPGRTKTKMRASLYPNEDAETLLLPEDIAYVVERVVKDPIISLGMNIGIKRRMEKYVAAIVLKGKSRKRVS